MGLKLGELNHMGVWNSVLRKKLGHKQHKAEADCKERSGEGFHGLY
jgi:hypothetical protein